MKTALLLLLLGAVSHAAEVLDRVAASVNGDRILFSELRAETAPHERTLRETLKGQSLVEAIKALRTSQLNRMIDRLLLLQELKRRGFPLPAPATDEQIDATIKDRFGSDRQQWLKSLKRKAAIKIY